MLWLLRRSVSPYVRRGCDVSVRVNDRGTTTVTMREGKLRCRRCSKKSEVLTVDANGTMVCEECAGEKWIPAKVVGDAPETTAR